MSSSQVIETVTKNIDKDVGQSMFAIVMNADIFGQSIIILLLLMSVGCWAIIFAKTIEFKRLSSASEKFDQMFWSGESLYDLFIRIRKSKRYPMSSIFIVAMEEWELSFNETKNEKLERNFILEMKDRINKAIQVSKNRSVEEIEKSVIYLSVISSSAPFIGLLGTVWGVMNSFQAIAVSDNTSLSVVAPGISEALFATAVGLFAAIPAVIAYNYMINYIDKYIVKLDDFADELTSLLFRELQKQKSL